MLQFVEQVLSLERIVLGTRKKKSQLSSPQMCIPETMTKVSSFSYIARNPVTEGLAMFEFTEQGTVGHPALAGHRE